MNERQREYFRQKLLDWKEEILKEARETLQHLQDENQNHPDLADRASSETDRAIELRARDRQRKLIAKIDAAIQRIEDGTYGYCEETGEPISLKRLEARPIATLSIEAQERRTSPSRLAAATASCTAMLMPTPPIGDMAWAASPMQSKPGLDQCSSRSTATLRSFMSSQPARSSMCSSR